jgi:hypothetical protein
MNNATALAPQTESSVIQLVWQAANYAATQHVFVGYRTANTIYGNKGA